MENKVASEVAGMQQALGVTPEVSTPDTVAESKPTPEVTPEPTPEPSPEPSVASDGDEPVVVTDHPKPERTETEERAARFQTDLQDLKTGIESMVPGLSAAIMSKQRERPFDERFKVDPNVYTDVVGQTDPSQQHQQQQSAQQYEEPYNDPNAAVVGDLTVPQFQKLQRDSYATLRNQEVSENNAVVASQEYAAVDKKLSEFKLSQKISDDVWNQVVGLTYNRGGFSIKSMQQVPGESSRFLESFSDTMELTRRRDSDTTLQNTNSAISPASNNGSTPTPDLSAVAQPQVGAVVASGEELTPRQKDIQAMKLASGGGILDQLRREGRGG